MGGAELLIFLGFIEVGFFVSIPTVVVLRMILRHRWPR